MSTPRSFARRRAPALVGAALAGLLILTVVPTAVTAQPGEGGSDAGVPATGPDGTAGLLSEPGLQLSFQPVPTSTVRGPDGALYVSRLTGFPFPSDGACIWRVGPDGAPRIWATGLTNVIDLAFDARGRLYALQLSDVGLFSETGPPSGSLVRVTRGRDEHRTMVDDLHAPSAVDLHSGDAWITTCTVCSGQGEVMRFDLDR